MTAPTVTTMTAMTGPGPDHPLPLALEDFVPVLLTATALVLLVPYARRLGTARWAALAAGLVTAGGLAKAGWKLIVALDGPDLRWLYHALFPLLSIGFLVLLYALYRPAAARSERGARGARSTQRARITLGGCLAVPALLGLVAAAAVGDTWPAMAVAIAAVSVLTVRLMLFARRHGDTLAVVLFGLWQLGQYLLGPMAARAEQSIALQWVEQSFNTVAQGAFAFAAWRLSRAGTAMAAGPAEVPAQGASVRDPDEIEEVTAT